MAITTWLLGLRGGDDPTRRDRAVSTNDGSSWTVDAAASGYLVTGGYVQEGSTFFAARTRTDGSWGADSGVYKSLNGGLTWAKATGSTVRTVAIAKGNGKIVAIGDSPSYSFTFRPFGHSEVSTDNGATFAIGATPDTNIGDTLRFGGGKFLAASTIYEPENYVRTSVDGVTWSANIPVTVAAGVVACVEWCETQWVLIPVYSGANKPSHYTSPDGVTWTSRTSAWGVLTDGSAGAASTTGVRQASRIVRVANGDWIVGLGLGYTRFGAGIARSSDNGTTWAMNAVTLPGTREVGQIAVAGSKIVAVGFAAGTSSNFALTSTDSGQNFTDVPTAFASQATLTGTYRHALEAFITGNEGGAVALPPLDATGEGYGRGSAAYPLFPLYAVQPPPVPSFWTRRTRARERA